MARDTETKPAWFGEGLRFACTQCGNCCTGPEGYVWFTPEEGRAIAQRLQLTDAEFKKRYAKRVFHRWSLSENIQPNGDHDCVFLDRDDQGKALCSIYEDRPSQCRTWPFWPSNLKSPRHWADAAQTCPGMQDPTGTFVPIDRVRVLADRSPGL